MTIKKEEKLISYADLDNLKNKITKKEKQIKTIKKEYKKDKEKFLRNIADLQNLLKRKVKEFLIEESQKKGWSVGEDIVKTLCPKCIKEFQREIWQGCLSDNG